MDQYDEDDEIDLNHPEFVKNHKLIRFDIKDAIYLYFS